MNSFSIKEMSNYSTDGYDDFFNNMKKKISESKLNTNGLNVRKKIIIIFLF